MLSRTVTSSSSIAVRLNFLSALLVKAWGCRGRPASASAPIDVDSQPGRGSAVPEIQACPAVSSEAVVPAGEDVGHYGGSYKVTFDLYKKFGESRLLDTPICGAPPPSLSCRASLSPTSLTPLHPTPCVHLCLSRCACISGAGQLHDEPLVWRPC